MTVEDVRTDLFVDLVGATSDDFSWLAFPFTLGVLVDGVGLSFCDIALGRHRKVFVPLIRDPAALVVVM